MKAEGHGPLSTHSSRSHGQADSDFFAYADDRTRSVSAAVIISGPGGPRDDSVLAWVSDREAIIRASSVKRYGVEFIRSINEGTAPREVAMMGRPGLPRYADGTVPAREAFTTPRSAPPGTFEGGTGGGLTLNISNSTPATVIAREVRDDRGQRRLEVQIDEATATAVGRDGSRTRQALSRPRVAQR